MAIETPNVVEAAGIFDGKTVPTFPNPILSSNGIQAYDPSTTSANPKGGFTLVALSAFSILYEIRMVNPIDGGEGIVLVTELAENLSAQKCVPGAQIAPDGQINVRDKFNSGSDIENASVPFSFYMAVLRITYGPNISADPNP
jgi:hypothetical protein